MKKIKESIDSSIKSLKSKSFKCKYTSIGKLGQQAVVLHNKSPELVTFHTDLYTKMKKKVDAAVIEDAISDFSKPADHSKPSFSPHTTLYKAAGFFAAKLITPFEFSANKITISEFRGKGKSTISTDYYIDTTKKISAFTTPTSDPLIPSPIPGHPIPQDIATVVKNKISNLKIFFDNDASFLPGKSSIEIFDQPQLYSSNDVFSDGKISIKENTKPEYIPGTGLIGYKIDGHPISTKLCHPGLRAGIQENSGK